MKINFALLIWVGITLSSCTGISVFIKNANKFDGIDPKLIPYFDKFSQNLSPETKKRFKKQRFAAGFGSIGKKGKAIGTCLDDHANPPEIEIDKEYWKTAEESSRTALVFHELGHCFCKKEHTDKNSHLRDIVNRCPISIMNPSIPNPTCLESYWDEYIEEFFDNCSG
jgi:hypothetical protein